MLLTITYNGENAEDLGYLLYKNPWRPQEFSLTFGKAYVFYPEISQHRMTCALLLDIDPIQLARGKENSGSTGLFDYLNDRPYVCSSFMSTAISRVFGTAMSGRADSLQHLADSPLSLTANITMLPCRGDKQKIKDVFEPLGYTVGYTTSLSDEEFPEWGESPYVDLTITGKVRLRDLLSHLYILLPAFDRKKHYWVDKNEVDKLLEHAREWLKDHPEKAYITRNYLRKRKYLVTKAMQALNQASLEESGDSDDEYLEESEIADLQTPQPDETFDQRAQKRLSLQKQRIKAVSETLKESGASSVLDIGCGEGALLKELAKDSRYKKLIGADVSMTALRRARSNLEREIDKNKVSLLQSSVLYKDDRCAGTDAVAVVEVLEHIDKAKLVFFEKSVFDTLAPNTIIITTPNAEYNVLYENLPVDRLRHADHRFEWTRSEFADWARTAAEKYGYSLKLSGIGEEDEKLGSPTQMGVFEKCR